MNGYDLTRQWFDFAFENPDLITGNHAAVYLWNVELNNRMGWVSKFASPASQAMAAAGIKSYNTYKKIFQELVEWGFIEIVQESKNQYTSNIIALSKIDKALDKALDKAMTMHLTTHSESTIQSTSSIIKQINQQTNKPINIIDADGVGEEKNISDSQLEEKEKKEPPKVAPKGSTKFNPEKAELPFGKEFEKAWIAWCHHRKEIKKPLTETTVEAQLKKLGSYSESVAIAFITQSIEKGWQGLIFELKDAPFNNSPPGIPPKGKIQTAVENTKTAAENIRRRRELENQQ